MCGLYPGTTCPSTSRVFYLSFVHFATISDVAQRIASQTAERTAEQKAFNDSVKLENERKAREQSAKLEEIERQNLAKAAAQLERDEEERAAQLNQ